MEPLTPNPGDNPETTDEPIAKREKLDILIEKKENEGKTKLTIKKVQNDLKVKQDMSC